MSDKVEPCAWCGKEPEVLAPSWPDIVWCSDPGCLERSSWELPEWNARQARILAARKADFNEARMAFRTAGAFEEVPGLLLELPGDNLWYWKDFEDYIKEGA